MSTQPAQPAAPAAPQAPAAPIDMNALVDVKIDGQVTREPLSKLVQSYSLQGAVQNRLAEVNRLRADLMEKQQVYDREINFARAYQETARTDPEALVRQAAMHARQMSGREVAIPGAQAQDHTNTQPQGDPQPQSQRVDPALLGEVHQLRAKVQAIETESRVDRLTQEIGHELSRYPLFTNPADPVSVEARAQAEMIVSALRASNPNAPVADLVTQAHGRLEKLVRTQTQQVYDNRTATAAAVPAVPTGGGTPQLSNQGAPLTVADLKSGRAKDMLSNIFRAVAPTR